MSKHCDDCGTKLSDGICPNCHEELFINDYQMPEFDIPVSKKWAEKVKEQREEVRSKKIENSKFS